MQAKLLRCWRIFFLCFFSFSLFALGSVHAQILAERQRPHKNPQELVSLFAPDEPGFTLTVANTAPLPILMRPTQLAWRDTAALNTLLAQDRTQLQSTLTDHWPRVHQVITRFLPDHVDLHPISKVFSSVRDTCNSTHTEAACREHLLEIDNLIKNNRYQARTFFMTLEQLPYRDPAPIDNLQRLNETQLRNQLANNWPQIDSLLNQYIGWNVALVGEVNFARSRLDCQAWMPGDYYLCRMYFRNLATLMRDKIAARANLQSNPLRPRQ